MDVELPNIKAMLLKQRECVVEEIVEFSLKHADLFLSDITCDAFVKLLRRLKICSASKE